MKPIIAAAMLFAVMLGAPAYAAAATAGAATPAKHHVVTTKHPHRTAKAPRTSNHEVTYDRDSKDPNIGWHTQGGMRVCTEDCDNPEIPGSGYTCRDVNFLGMAMRECDSSSW